MDINDLEQILEEIPILLISQIIVRKSDGFYTGLNLAVNKTKPDGTALRYTIIPHDCDDMVRSLLYASIQHYYGGLSEEHSTIAENLFWERPVYRKACQDKIVKLCEKHGL